MTCGRPPYSHRESSPASPRPAPRDRFRSPRARRSDIGATCLRAPPSLEPPRADPRSRRPARARASPRHLRRLRVRVTRARTRRSSRTPRRTRPCRTHEVPRRRRWPKRVPLPRRSRRRRSVRRDRRPGRFAGRRRRLRRVVDRLIGRLEAAGVRGVWLQIPIEQAQLVGAAAGGRLRVPPRRKTHVMMTKWLPGIRRRNLPPNASRRWASARS